MLRANRVVFDLNALRVYGLGGRSDKKNVKRQKKQQATKKTSLKRQKKQALSYKKNKPKRQKKQAEATKKTRLKALGRQRRYLEASLLFMFDSLSWLSRSS